MRHRMVATMTSWGLILTAAGVSAGQEASVDLQKALDKTVELSVADAPIAKVFESLATQTGVKFVIPPETQALLPYADQTRLAVTLKNVTLRKALAPMLAQQALQWIVEGDEVRIVPKEALYRLGRRATYEEFRQLGAIYSGTLQPTAKGGPVLEQLRAALGNKELALSFPVGVDATSAMNRAGSVLPCVASEWMEAVCAGQGWTWLLRDDALVVLPLRAQVERQLRTRTSLRYESAPLMDVLLDLARKSRVKLLFGPGVLEYLPVQVREGFNLAMSDATIDQALEVIAGATGLVFLKTNEGVLVEASETLKRRSEQSATQPARRRAPFFVKMNVPLADGSTAEVFLMPDELPAEVVDAIQAEKVTFVEKLRQSLPRTGAASRPAEE